LCIAELLGDVTMVFGTAVLPQLAQGGTRIGRDLMAHAGGAAGIVMGALLSAIFNVADVFSAPRCW